MVAITPTITTDDAHEYRDQMNLISTYSEGVHLDFADGLFAPSELLPIAEAWRGDTLITHAHIMYTNPLSVVSDILALDADLVILHAESDNVKKALEILNENGTRTGIALLPDTPVEAIKELGIAGLIDHVLLFEGHLGYQGGEAHLEHVSKARQLKSLYPEVELAWDGGVNKENVVQLVETGISVLNVGGYLKNAKDPQKAYDTLSSLIS